MKEKRSRPAIDELAMRVDRGMLVGQKSLLVGILAQQGIDDVFIHGHASRVLGLDQGADDHEDTLNLLKVFLDGVRLKSVTL